MPKLFFRLILPLTLFLTLAFPTTAQDDLTVVVVDSLASLDTGYHFISSNHIDILTIWEEDNELSRSGSTSRSVGLGDVDAERNFYTSGTSNQTTFFESEEETTISSLDHARVDGVDMVNLISGEFINEDFSEIEPGWHRVEDIEQILSDSFVGRAALEQWRSVRPNYPSLETDYISSVTEMNAAQIDGVAMRVIAINLNAHAMHMTSVLGEEEVTLDDLVNMTAVLIGGTFEENMIFWIGAEDGQLYRVTSESYTIFPYRTLGGQRRNLRPYDLTVSYSYQVDYSHHGAVDPIESPIP